VPLHPGCDGDSYSYWQGRWNNCGPRARALWTAHLKGLGATADNLLVMHGARTNCFAHDASAGSMAAFSVGLCRLHQVDP
jgi:hypothetical protein